MSTLRVRDSEAGGEEVRVLTLDNLRAIQRSVEQCPIDKQHDEWQNELTRIRQTATPEVLSKYSEYSVPRSVAELADDGAPTEEADFRGVKGDKDGEVKEDENLLMNNHN